LKCYRSSDMREIIPTPGYDRGLKKRKRKREKGDVLE
jgi:hypothetical protein